MNPVLPAADLAGYLTRYPVEVTFGDTEPAEVFDRYHASGFVLINDGIPLDRERLLAHVASGRKRAARYVLTAVMQKGQTIETEIFMFGRLAPDGRLAAVNQLTRTIG